MWRQEPRASGSLNQNVEPTERSPPAVSAHLTNTERHHFRTDWRFEKTVAGKKTPNKPCTHHNVQNEPQLAEFQQRRERALSCLTGQATATTGFA